MTVPRNKLKQLGIKPNISELKQVENDLAELENREADLEKKYDFARKVARDLEQKYRNITDYLEHGKRVKKIEHEMSK